jgi:hypothetical protein
MRRDAMTCQKLTIAMPLLLLAAGCDAQEQPTTPTPQSTVRPVAAPGSQSTTPPAASPAPLDEAALNERQDPARVLRYYAAALAASDWQAASRAWGTGSGVSSITLQAEYGGKGGVTLQPGVGEIEGAAGSLFYEAPVMLRFAEGGETRTGTITLRRVNDVEGATPEQLRWHIERSTVGPTLKN